MTNDELIHWGTLTSRQKIRKFKKIRKSLGITQAELGEKLRIYGYSSGASAVKKWETAAITIPVFVYELMIERFAERKYNPGGM